VNQLARAFRESHTIFEHFVEMLEMRHDDVSMFLQNCQCNEDVEIATIVISPKRLPESQDIGPFEFSLVPDKEHTEEKEEVCGIGGLEMEIEFRIHNLDEMIECKKLFAHAGLIAKEIALLIIVSICLILDPNCRLPFAP
jgi:hypothetical protein